MELEEFKDLLLYRQIVKCEDKCITLDNGIEIIIEDDLDSWGSITEGHFINTKLNAVITDVSDIKKVTSVTDVGACWVEATIKMFHNQNLICQIEANADGDRYYWSLAFLRIKFPINEKNKFLTLINDYYDEISLMEKRKKNKL